MTQRHASPLSSVGCVAIVATPLHLGSCRASWGKSISSQPWSTASLAPLVRSAIQVGFDTHMLLLIIVSMLQDVAWLIELCQCLYLSLSLGDAGEQQAGELRKAENGHARPEAPSLAARPDPLVSLKELVRPIISQESLCLGQNSDT